MKFTLTSVAVAALSFTAVSAQNSSASAAAPSASSSAAAGNGTMAGNSTMDPTAYATGLLGALQANNLTTLATIAQANVGTLLPLLMSSGNKTIFAPTNEAFAALPENVTSNAELVANVVLYHIYYGAFPAANLSANHTIARSALNASSLVNLPQGQTQVAVLTAGQNSSVTVNQATSNVTSVATATYANLIVHVVPTVLTVPESVINVATAAGLTGLIGAITTNAAAAAPGLVSARGLTVFAPVNSAFEAAQGLISTLNMSTIANVLLNHIINGTVVYSTQITPGANVTSAGGSPLSFMTNATGVFVMSGNSTARIIRADIPTANGVVHLISGVLANTASNPQAAASAASSAAAATSQAPRPTGAVTATGSAPAASGSRPASAGDKVVVGGLLGAALAVAGVLAL